MKRSLAVLALLLALNTLGACSDRVATTPAKTDTPVETGDPAQKDDVKKTQDEPKDLGERMVIFILDMLKEKPEPIDQALLRDPLDD